MLSLQTWWNMVESVYRRTPLIFRAAVKGSLIGTALAIMTRGIDRLEGHVDPEVDGFLVLVGASMGLVGGVVHELLRPLRERGTAFCSHRGSLTIRQCTFFGFGRSSAAVVASSSLWSCGLPAGSLNGVRGA